MPQRQLRGLRRCRLYGGWSWSSMVLEEKQRVQAVGGTHALDEGPCGKVAALLQCHIGAPPVLWRKHVPISFGVRMIREVSQVCGCCATSGVIVCHRPPHATAVRKCRCRCGRVDLCGTGTRVTGPEIHREHGQWQVCARTRAPRSSVKKSAVECGACVHHP